MRGRSKAIPVLTGAFVGAALPATCTESSEPCAGVDCSWRGYRVCTSQGYLIGVCSPSEGCQCSGAPSDADADPDTPG